MIYIQRTFESLKKCFIQASKVVIDRRRKKTETVSVGATEVGLRGNQEFLSLILNLNTAIFMDFISFEYFLGLD